VVILVEFFGDNMGREARKERGLMRKLVCWKKLQGGWMGGRIVGHRPAGTSEKVRAATRADGLWQTWSKTEEGGRG